MLVAYMQKFITHSFGGWEVLDQGTASVSGEIPLPSY